MTAQKGGSSQHMGITEEDDAVLRPELGIEERFRSPRKQNERAETQGNG